MIHLRKNPFSETSIEVNYIPGEKASELLERTLKENNYESAQRQGFHIVVNGLSVDKDMWEYVEIKESDYVLITPIIARGAGGQLFKQIALVVIAVAAAAFGQAYISSAALAAAFTAGVTIAATLALNSLIPPPGLGLGGLGSAKSDYDGSQMYTITSQSNNAKKFGFVPKVYGSHRIFPLIAANPYTEIEADPSTGNLVQFFYCIYDFGFGPLEVTDIKIGDTPITDYGDANFRLVDLNKPAVSEGPWDDLLFDDFAFYKGDVERDGTSVALDFNQNDSGAVLDDYQFVRNASSKVNGNSQEISVDFVAPQGLIAYASNGKTYDRKINLKIEFSKVGEDVWRPYNDADYVYDFDIAGGASVYATKWAEVYTIDPTQDSPIGFSYLSRTEESFWIFGEYYGQYQGEEITPDYTDHDHNPSTLPIKMVSSDLTNFGFVKGQTQILLKTISSGLGDALIVNGNVIGYVESITSSIYPDYSWFNLTAPIKTSVVLYTVRRRFVESRDTSGGKAPEFQTFLYDSKVVGSGLSTDKVQDKFLSLGVAQIVNKNAQAVYATVKFKPKQIAAYKIRVTRTSSTSTQSYRVQDKLSLVSISTRFDRKPILTDKRHVFLEVRVRATNQLNGAIQNLSATAESILDVYDTNTDTWIKQRTNNPAWVYCDLLTGPLNKRAISKSRLHMESILEWAEFCAEIPTPPVDQSFTTSRFTCNFVLDFDTTLQGIINNITSASQSSMNIVDGKYGVLIDKLKTVPVQVFTQRNSSSFSSSRNYSDPPHGLKIRYIDPFKNWDVAEAIVYDNGYDAETATRFDELSTFACTNYEQAWRFGRYMLAQSRLRKENISITVDFEYLVCTRGDFVQITQDVMMAGGRPARVKSVTGNRVLIDDGIDTLGGVDYGYVYRSVSDGVKTDTLTVVSSDEFDLDGDLPAVGDLIIIGEVGKIVFDCIVKSITPNSDLSANLELIEKADDVYTAESSEYIPNYDPKLTLNVDSEYAVPPAVEDLVVVTNSWRVVGGAYEYYIGIDWETPTGAAVDTYEIYVDSGKGYNLIDYTKESFYEYIVNPLNLDILHSFKVLAVSANGKKLDLIDAATVTATPLKKTAPPSNVLSLSINITNQVIQLDWPANTDVDLKEYILRYSPRTVDYNWETSIPLARADKNSTAVSVQGRKGTYFIKALDLNGNESSVASFALTTIPNLFDLNIIEETNDFPDLEGELVTVVKDSNALSLKKQVSGGFETNQFYPEGFYYYKDFLDLGDIYTVRLQSLIEAEGFTVGDLMSDWNPLSDVLALSSAGQAQWDVETQYRTTDQLNAMSEWDALSDINPISEGDQDNWTEWKKFIMGDATGRIFQFRLRLISYIASVTPRVFDGIIRADMPDRLESYNNLITDGVNGLEIVYNPPFKGPGTTPNIQITQDNASQGDYYILENKTLDGFKITFYDKDAIAVNRQFDVSVKGYGRKALAVI